VLTYDQTFAHVAKLKGAKVSHGGTSHGRRFCKVDFGAKDVLTVVDQPGGIFLTTEGIKSVALADELRATP